MRKYLLISGIILSSIVSLAQNFNDCAADFRSKWKKINVDAATQKRDDRKMDSLYRALETAFDDCILGNELPEFSLMTLNGKLFTNESIAGKVVT